MAIKKRSATVVPGASGAAAAVKNPQASKTSFWGELPQHVMSGISRMVLRDPLIISPKRNHV